MVRKSFWSIVFSSILTISVCPAVAQSVVVQTLAAEPVTDWSEPSFWETIDGQPVESNWQFRDGEIRLVRPRGGSGSLLSGPLPVDFQLSWKWKIDEKTNTGLKYRVRKFGSRWLGVEYQIIDDPASSSSTGSTASIYDLFAPVETKVLHPAGEWNSSRVVAVGHRLRHYLNGDLVAQTWTVGPEWQAAYAVSKFWGAEGFADRDGEARIMLTDHGGRAVYKDFQFEPLQPAAEDLAEPHTKGPFLGNAFRNGWAEQDSIVIWTRTTARPEMNVDGPPFKELRKSEQKRYANLRDPDQLLAVQLPDDTALEDMFGAMPGAPGQVRLTYFPTAQRKQSKSTPWVSTSAENDFTAQWKLGDLKADSRYAVVVEARALGSDRTSAVVRGGFRTPPAVEDAKSLKFCMTTCHDFIRRDDGPRGHKIYASMSKLAPDFVVHAGDIEYYDKPDPWAWTKQLMRFKWGRIFALPANRDFYAQTTSYFLKDDHDTLKNDCWAGQRYGSVTFEQGVKLFNEEQFPSRSPRYQTIRWGHDVQIWLLEGRDYRSPNTMPDGPQKTILGDEQKAWLFTTLEQSDARFKLIFSPTPVIGPDRANKKDNHANQVFAYEGQQLRTELSKQAGVIVFCGDRHWQYASVDEQTGLWEFGCGPGSEKHQLGWKKGDERPEHRFLRVAGGFLFGRVKEGKGKNQTTLILQHRTVGGEVVSEFAFPQTQPQVTDEDAAANRERGS